MNLLRRFSIRDCFRQVMLYLAVCCLLVVCCMVFSISPSAIQAGPKGKGLALGHAHGNPHANPQLNPHGSLKGGGASLLSGGGLNPAGIQVGAGSGAKQGLGTIGTTSFNTGSVANPKVHVISGGGNQMFFGKPNSNVIVKIASLPPNSSAINQVKNKCAGHPSGKGIALAAGDIFSSAIENLNTLSEPLVVPDPIGAKGANPVHGGSHANKGDGNPGGGNGKGHWGQGNSGNGVGNIWTGNQGRGVGEGMAGGRRPEPPEPPEPPVPPKNNGEINTEPAPLYREAGQAAEEEEFEEGGCPALMNWFVNELELDEENQISIDSAFTYSTDIQPCDLSARLKDAAGILAEPNGVAALAEVVNEFVAPEAPISDERMAMIAAALAGHTDDGTHYAEASRWLDALVEYIGILNNEIGWPISRCVAFVLDKYGKPIEETGDVNVIAYIRARLTGLIPSDGKVRGSGEAPASENPQSLHANEGTGPFGTDAAIAPASAMPIYVFGGLGILGAVGAVLVRLASLKKNR
ncbi:MAG: hypothetical protein JSV99_10760 [Planctomycetota bacterium]|nr:MAG: hypothetical protein JSV99_10760 [Planctomycetota bacterium]